MLDEQLLEQMRKAVSDPSSVPQIDEVEKWQVQSAFVLLLELN
jgi:hypothetical protein